MVWIKLLYLEIDGVNAEVVLDVLLRVIHAFLADATDPPADLLRWEVVCVYGKKQYKQIF